MYQTLGELLPLAVGVSISPLPIIAMIVLLMSSHARASTPAFVVGWVAAIAAALVLFAYLSGLQLGGGGNARFAAIARLILGLALLYLAYREWRTRPAPGEAGHLPHWLTAVENMRALPAAALGFGIYAANPKNLTVGVAAGVTFGSARLPVESAVVVGTVYVLIAASTVLIPVAAYFIAESRVRRWLDETRGWRTLHNAALMAVLLWVIGAVMIGKTFVLLDVSAAVADGVAWHGRRVQAGSVAYVSFEGDALGLRLRALVDCGGRTLTHLHVLRARSPLSPRLTRDGEERAAGELDLSRQLSALSAVLSERSAPAIALVIIDTVRASMTGSEDSSEHVSAYLRAIRRLMALTPSAAWILAHHAGWQDGENPRRRERGSSAWRGNCDATLYLEAGAYDVQAGNVSLTLRTLKVRDGERPAPLHLICRRVELAEPASDDLPDGPRTSCIVVADRRTPAERGAEQTRVVEARTQAIDRRVLQAIRDCPAATNTHALRQHVGLSYPLVRDAVARILQAGWATSGTRGKPYQITPSGQAQLA